MDEKFLSGVLRQLAFDYSDKASECMRRVSVLDMNEDEFAEFERFTNKASALLAASKALREGGDDY